MKITKINSLIPYLINSRIIGFGSTAICFLMPNGKIIKVYRNTINKKLLFDRFNMTEHLLEISKLKNNTYIAPEEILLENNTVVAYIYKYVNAKKLSRINGNQKVFDMFRKYDLLLKDTKEISDKDFTLADIHSGNILFNEQFYVIDLDQGYYNGKKYSDKYKANIDNLMKEYVYTLFKVRMDEIFYFKKSSLQELYRKLKWDNIDSIYEFLYSLAQYIDIKNPSINDIRKNKLIYKAPNTYYKPF